MLLYVIIGYAIALPLSLELRALAREIGRRQAERESREIQKMLEQLDELKKSKLYEECFGKDKSRD